MEADDLTLWGGTKGSGGLLKALHDYEDRLDEKKERLAMWRAKNAVAVTSKTKKI